MFHGPEFLKRGIEEVRHDPHRIPDEGVHDVEEEHLR
jgi:hypothetical protein